MDTIFPKESEMHHFDIIRQAGRIKEREIKIIQRKIYMERERVYVRERESEKRDLNEPHNSIVKVIVERKELL